MVLASRILRGLVQKLVSREVFEKYDTYLVRNYIDTVST